MQPTARDKKVKIIPKNRQQHYSRDESVNEPAKLIKDEPVEAEAEVPVEENKPVERTQPEDRSDPHAFNEE